MKIDLMEDNYCFACGKENPIGLKMDIKSVNGKAICKLNLDKRYQGYHGIIHGGIIATILDEIMVYSLFSLNYKVLTYKFEIKYKKAVLVDSDIVAEAIIEDRNIKHNRVKAKSQLRDSKGNLLAEAKGEYVIV